LPEKPSTHAQRLSSESA
jgi:hypothetical protein